MKSIEVDDELYAYIASQTKAIGESASDILRRLLLSDEHVSIVDSTEAIVPAVPKTAAKPEQSKANKTETIKATAEPKTTPKVQPSVNGNLSERITAKNLSAFDKKVDKFLFVLSQLYQLHQDSFTVIEEIRGKDRLYFATSEASLTATGNSTNPKSIPDSPYWVVTNNNSEKKARLLSQAMSLLGYDEQTIHAVVELVNQ